MIRFAQKPKGASRGCARDSVYRGATASAHGRARGSPSDRSASIAALFDAAMFDELSFSLVCSVRRIRCIGASLGQVERDESGRKETLGVVRSRGTVGSHAFGAASGERRLLLRRRSGDGGGARGGGDGGGGGSICALLTEEPRACQSRC